MSGHLRGDARKRLHPAPLPHWSPDVVALIEKARAEGLAEGVALAVEYRVMFRDSREPRRWWSHTGNLVTDNPEIAEAWREQATHNGGRSGPTDVVIESRVVGPWTRDTSREVTP